MKCMNCGSSIDTSMKFCEYCGTPVRDSIANNNKLNPGDHPGGELAFIAWESAIFSLGEMSYAGKTFTHLKIGDTISCNGFPYTIKSMKQLKLALIPTTVSELPAGAMAILQFETFIEDKQTLSELKSGSMFSGTGAKFYLS